MPATAVTSHRTNTIFTYNCASSALANTAINTQQLIALLSRTLLLSCHLNDSLKQYGFRWSGLVQEETRRGEVKPQLGLLIVTAPCAVPRPPCNKMILKIYMKLDFCYPPPSVQGKIPKKFKTHLYVFVIKFLHLQFS